MGRGIEEGVETETETERQRERRPARNTWREKGREMEIEGEGAESKRSKGAKRGQTHRRCTGWCVCQVDTGWSYHTERSLP